jgi:hypothetical protein
MRIRIQACWIDPVQAGVCVNSYCWVGSAHVDVMMGWMMCGGWGVVQCARAGE